MSAMSITPVPLLRGVLPQSGWKPQELLHWVPAVASAAPELARLLIRKAMN